MAIPWQPNTTIGTTTGVTVNSSTEFQITASSFPNGNLLDGAAASSRRLKISTPFGTIVSDNNSTGSFTVSATAAYLGNTAATFAGGGFDGAAATYTLGNGNLVINGSNFLGVKTITLEDNASIAYIIASVNPAAPPAGITFNATGTQITITAAYITAQNAAWANSATFTNRARETHFGSRYGVGLAQHHHHKGCCLQHLC